MFKVQFLKGVSLSRSCKRKARVLSQDSGTFFKDLKKRSGRRRDLPNHSKTEFDSSYSISLLLIVDYFLVVVNWSVKILFYHNYSIHPPLE